MKRTLVLKRETLAELDTDELSHVHGASVFCTSALTFCDVVCRATETTAVAVGNTTTLIQTWLCPTTG